MGETLFIPDSAQTLNAFVTVVALIVGVAQLMFLYNMIWSLLTRGKKAEQQSLAGHHAGMADARNPAGARQLGRSCRSSIAGPTTTACRAPKRTSCRRTTAGWGANAEGGDDGLAVAPPSRPNRGGSDGR